MRLLRLSSLLVMSLAVAACSGDAPDDVRDTEGGGKADADGDGIPDEELAAFVLEERLELVDAVMAIRTNLPAWAEACAALPLREAPCADEDGDGLTDAWEALVLERMSPLLRLDEKEPYLDDAQAATAIIGRVAPVGDDILISLALLYTRDYGKCGFTAHPGDSESAALHLSTDGEAGDYRLTGAFTAAHQDESNDQSRTYTGNALAQFLYVADAFTDMPRWVVFSAVAKHATYATASTCEAVNKYIPCVREDCSPDGVPNPGDYDLRPPVANAGELEAPLLTALDVFGFPGEDAWADQTFCGGIRQDGCAPGVRKRLLFNPF
jgi:hypothetical protein